MNRLRLLRQEKGVSQEELGKLIGKTGQAYGLYENGKRTINQETLLILAEYFNVSVDYILGNSEIKKPTDLNKKLYLIPVLGRVPAGEPLLAEENIEGYLPIDPLMYDLSSPNNIFFLRVQGESMNKVVSNGSYVLIRKQENVENGDVVVAIVNGDNEATLKRFKNLDNGFVMLEPDSTYSEFSPRIINLKDTDFKIIGKVIGDFKKW